MAAHQAPLSLGFSRQEHWSGSPFPSPMHESEKWKWSRSVVSDSLRPHGLQPIRLLHAWDFPGKSTGVWCHYILYPWWNATTGSSIESYYLPRTYYILDLYLTRHFMHVTFCHTWNNFRNLGSLFLFYNMTAWVSKIWLTWSDWSYFLHQNWTEKRHRKIS